MNRNSALRYFVWLGPTAASPCLVAATLMTATYARSAPVGPVVPLAVPSGTAVLSTPGNILNPSQNTGGPIINWSQFNIGSGNSAKFVQPAASSSVLNRLTNDAAATITGVQRSSDGGKVSIGSGTSQFGETRISVGGSIAITSNGGITQDIVILNGQTVLVTGAKVSLVDAAMPGIKVEITGAKGGGTNLDAVVSAAGRRGIGGLLVGSSGVPGASSVVYQDGRILLRAAGR